MKPTVNELSAAAAGVEADTDEATGVASLDFLLQAVRLAQAAVMATKHQVRRSSLVFAESSFMRHEVSEETSFRLVSS